MKNKYPIRGKTAYRDGLALRAESTILGSGRGNLDTLEYHLPGILMSSVEEPVQSSVLGRVELPQVENPLLAQEDPAEIGRAHV